MSRSSARHADCARACAKTAWFRQNPISWSRAWLSAEFSRKVGVMSQGSQTGVTFLSCFVPFSHHAFLVLAARGFVCVRVLGEWVMRTRTGCQLLVACRYAPPSPLHPKRMVWPGNAAWLRGACMLTNQG